MCENQLFPNVSLNVDRVTQIYQLWDHGADKGVLFGAASKIGEQFSYPIIWLFEIFLKASRQLQLDVNKPNNNTVRIYFLPSYADINL